MIIFPVITFTVDIFAVTENYLGNITSNIQFGIDWLGLKSQGCRNMDILNGTLQRSGLLKMELWYY